MAFGRHLNVMEIHIYIHNVQHTGKREGEGRGKMLCQSDGQISNSIMGVYGVPYGTRGID